MTRNWCLIGVGSLKSENGSFGRFERPAEPSAPTGGRFGRLWRGSCFNLRNYENEANLLVLP